MHFDVLLAYTNVAVAAKGRKVVKVDISSGSLFSVIKRQTIVVVVFSSSMKS